jgi:hypothetical protein
MCDPMSRLERNVGKFEGYFEARRLIKSIIMIVSSAVSVVHFND